MAKNPTARNKPQAKHGFLEKVMSMMGALRKQPATVSPEMVDAPLSVPGETGPTPFSDLPEKVELQDPSRR